MTTTYETPGVFIEEVPAEGVLQPVGTSTPAFIGPVSSGPVNQATFVTSFDQFRQTFGKDPVEGFYLWYAVRGFFENGGRRAWIVRASSGRAAHLDLLDSQPAGSEETALVVQARELGVPAPPLTADVDASKLVSATAFTPTFDIVKAALDTIQLDAELPLTASEVAARFRVGDKVRVQDATNSDEAVITNVAGDRLIVGPIPPDKTALDDTYTGGDVRLADLASGDTVIRLDAAAAGLGAGSIVEIEQGGAGPETAIVESVAVERIDPTTVTYKVTLSQGLANAYTRDGVDAIDVESREFTLTIAQGGSSETRANLSMAHGNPRYVGTVLAQQPFTDVHVQEPAILSTAPPVERLPRLTAATQLDGGAPDAPAALTLADYQAALDLLRTVDDVNFIATPDSQDAAVQLAVLTHCTTMQDRIAIFDAPPGATPLGPGENVLDRVKLLWDEGGFGGLYYPWINVPRPNDGSNLMAVPPSGHVAGVWARADTERGVHKAPANYRLNGALGVTIAVDDETQGPLNRSGVNVVRVFPGQARPMIWGARTILDPQAPRDGRQYLNIRRLLLFIEESIQEGIRWAVFEPNNPVLWEKLKRVIRAFLTAVWRDGALFGEKPEQAFYVRIDETNNPEDERLKGRLNVEIGLRAVPPAEFIVVRIGLRAGAFTVSET